MSEPDGITGRVPDPAQGRVASTNGWPYDLHPGRLGRRSSSHRPRRRYCSDGTVTVLLGDSSTVSIQPAATATEGTPLGFTVTLDSPAAIDVTVTFSTEADVGGAHPAASSDYLSRTDAQVTILAGQTQATARVFTVQDSIHEHDETLKVGGVSPAGR